MEDMNENLTHVLRTEVVEQTSLGMLRRNFLKYAKVHIAKRSCFQYHQMGIPVKADIFFAFGRKPEGEIECFKKNTGVRGTCTIFPGEESKAPLAQTLEGRPHRLCRWLEIEHDHVDQVAATCSTPLTTSLSP